MRSSNPFGQSSESMGISRKYNVLVVCLFMRDDVFLFHSLAEFVEQAEYNGSLYKVVVVGVVGCEIILYCLTIRGLTAKICSSGVDYSSRRRHYINLRSICNEERYSNAVWCRFFRCIMDTPIRGDIFILVWRLCLG